MALRLPGNNFLFNFPGKFREIILPKYCESVENNYIFGVSLSSDFLHCQFGVSFGEILFKWEFDIWIFECRKTRTFYFLRPQRPPEAELRGRARGHAAVLQLRHQETEVVVIRVHSD